VHAGFNGAFQQIWPATRAALAALATGPSPQVTQNFVTGHSLGGAVGSLLAYAAQSYLNSRFRAGRAPVVNAVLFAPPNAGPPAFVDEFNKRVNARRVVSSSTSCPRWLLLPPPPPLLLLPPLLPPPPPLLLLRT
jgi:hypothetical protein